MIELDDHPFFVASQFHPEFKSRPERPAPLFREFVAAALTRAAGGCRRRCRGRRRGHRRSRERGPHVSRPLVSVGPAGGAPPGTASTPSAPGVLRVEAVFHGVAAEQADTIAAELIGRAHELANLPEYACDVDVNVQRDASDAGSARGL